MDRKYNVFMWCCVLVTVIWVCHASFLCRDLFDELLLVLFGFGLMFLFVVIRRWRLLDK